MSIGQSINLNNFWPGAFERIFCRCKKLSFFVFFAINGSLASTNLLSRPKYMKVLFESFLLMTTFNQAWNDLYSELTFTAPHIIFCAKTQESTRKISATKWTIIKMLFCNNEIFEDRGSLIFLISLSQALWRQFKQMILSYKFCFWIRRFFNVFGAKRQKNLSGDRCELSIRSVR